MYQLEAILGIHALGDGKIANKWVINTHSHCDFAPNL